jgi:hypothetical protein
MGKFVVRSMASRLGMPILITSSSTHLKMKTEDHFTVSRPSWPLFVCNPECCIQFPFWTCAARDKINRFPPFTVIYAGYYHEQTSHFWSTIFGIEPAYFNTFCMPAGMPNISVPTLQTVYANARLIFELFSAAVGRVVQLRLAKTGELTVVVNCAHSRLMAI